MWCRYHGMRLAYQANIVCFQQCICTERRSGAHQWHPVVLQFRMLCLSNIAHYFDCKSHVCCAVHGAMLHSFLQTLMSLHSKYEHFEICCRDQLCKHDAEALYFWATVSYELMTKIASSDCTFCNVCARCGCHTHTHTHAHQNCRLQVAVCL